MIRMKLFVSGILITDCILNDFISSYAKCAIRIKKYQWIGIEAMLHIRIKIRNNLSLEKLKQKL